MEGTTYIGTWSKAQWNDWTSRTGLAQVATRQQKAQETLHAGWP